ncbi:MAG: DUF2851 family protein [Verrucomicrobiales bacterium]|nr:DUF2851 family protein [Verrucomicrobiales bacterium]
MNRIPRDFYERARIPFACEETVRDDATPPERWMQQIWRHQRIHRDRLQTLDGRPVQVLHPGFWNREAGPDFRDAVIRIGDDPAKRGDIELDRSVGGWRSHHHEGNPAYAGVILHVVWTAPSATLAPPVLSLRPVLDSPLGELSAWLEREAPGILPGNLPGSCCAPLRELPPEAFVEIVTQAARTRLRLRAEGFAVRALKAGWDQSLWEGLVGALGYKHNVWPMRRLAELTGWDAEVPAIPVPEESVAHWEARLMGIAGLLPLELPRGDARLAVRRLWDLWWRERDAWEDRILPAFLWKTGGVRPANHPQRRIILAARWRAAGSPASGLETWLMETGTRAAWVSRLRTLLSPPPIPGDYWLRHATLRSRASPRPMPLLGATRLAELALNVALPWLHARASAGEHPAGIDEIERRYFLWPPAGDNAQLRLARQRLFGGDPGPAFNTGACQQGIHQILRDFCHHAGPLCDECRFPRLVRSHIPAQVPSPSPAAPVPDPPVSQT